VEFVRGAVVNLHCKQAILGIAGLHRGNANWERVGGASSELQVSRRTGYTGPL